MFANPSSEDNIMLEFKRILKNFMQDESGEDLIEYAMAAGLVGTGAVVALKGSSGNVGAAFTSAASSIVRLF